MAALARATPRTPVEQVSPLGLVHPPPIHIECAGFTGSLGTLFLCVRDHKVDLAEVPLAPICQAYLSYLAEASEADLDESAAALAALAYLLERKAWGLLPVPEAEPELEEEAPDLVLLELYGESIDLLRLAAEEQSLLFSRPGLRLVGAAPLDLGGLTVADLARALADVLERAVPELPTVLSRPRRSLSEQMHFVGLMLDDDPKPLRGLIPGRFTRLDAVYTFLAILELIRLGRASVEIADGEPRFARAS